MACRELLFDLVLIDRPATCCTVVRRCLRLFSLVAIVVGGVFFKLGLERNWVDAWVFLLLLSGIVALVADCAVACCRGHSGPSGPPPPDDKPVSPARTPTLT